MHAHFLDFGLGKSLDFFSQIAIGLRPIAMIQDDVQESEIVKE
jgi:hypothetical protein